LPFFEGSREILIKIFIITSRFCILHMEALFVVAKRIGHLPIMIDYFFIQNCFKCDYDPYKVVSVNMTVTVLLRLATHDNVCDVRMCCVCKLDISDAVANLGVILIFNELCCEVICIRHGSLSLMLPCT